jgi:hypothetical protein
MVWMMVVVDGYDDNDAVEKQDGQFTWSVGRSNGSPGQQSVSRLRSMIYYPGQFLFHILQARKNN